MSVLSPLLFGLIILIILIAIFISIFFPEAFLPKPRINVTEICISTCKELALGRNLSKGPCLLDPIPNASDWVCDVAHKPREDVDNLPENQCSAFREGRATNFVEVTPECEFIRATAVPTHIFIGIKEGVYYYFGRLMDAMRKLLDIALSYFGLK